MYLSSFSCDATVSKEHRSFLQNSSDTPSHAALLGGKGSGLQTMCALELPVPPGCTFTTEVYRHLEKHGRYPSGLEEEFQEALRSMERAHGQGRRFGDSVRPLLVSVRSGAPVSMPGMMDTVLNLGLTEETVQSLIEETGDACFGWDVYRRFLMMYGNVVLGIGAFQETNPFSLALEEQQRTHQVASATELPVAALRSLVQHHKHILQSHPRAFLEDPWKQLWETIGAVFRSWHNERAISYRRLYNIPDSLGTAVTVQTMVFGNLDHRSGTGVLFTRNPNTGASSLYGEFLLHTQGEDVVSGVRTPRPLEELAHVLPETFQELASCASVLEKHFGDMQDIEFTIEKGRLWILQTRSGKRSTVAAIQIAVDLEQEHVISTQEALQRVHADALQEGLHTTLDPAVSLPFLVKGLPASPGAASGPIAFTALEAQAWAAQGHPAVLVRVETSPDDIEGMKTAAGILTARGGMTSHAAVVARGMGVCCVVGASPMEVDQETGVVLLGTKRLRAGEVITLDGNTGQVFVGAAPLVRSSLQHNPSYLTLLQWADEHRRLQVRANADTAEDAKTARVLGAQGIGLCRTEHMFFETSKLVAMLQMILAEKQEERSQALHALEAFQQQDFIALFQEMDGLPVTIRLLDPPLHEFLPKSTEDTVRMAHLLGIESAQLHQKAEALHESNPMLGYRGCRLGLVHPEIYEMQVRAIVSAANQARRQGVRVFPEIMVPLVATLEEMLWFRRLVDRVFAQQQSSEERNVSIGTMIELPRACLIADQLASHADFFSFGTNDLTQTTLGISRDDANRFLPQSIAQGIYEADPFVSLDRKGVGLLMKQAVTLARSIKPNFKIGVCGEHGGDPNSIAFFEELGLDYVSCSPFRLPTARVAAAQAATTTRS